MDYKTFEETVKSNVLDYLSEDFKDAKVEIRDIDKVNGNYRGLTINKEGQNVVPTINMDQMYQQMDSGAMSMQEVMARIRDFVEKDPIAVDVSKLMDYDKVKENLFIRVSSAEKNTDLLANVPHTQKEDLAITYHIATDIGEEGIASTIVTNQIMKELGVTKEQLHQDAMENSQKMIPAKVASMDSILRDMLIKDMQMQGMEQGEMDMILNEMFPADMGNKMYVVSNESGVLGASAAFYPEQMDKIGEQLGGDYYILPSSVHEMILVPDDGNLSPQELKDMVCEVNATQVAPEDRLTDEAYHYDTKDRVFEKADTFVKRQKEKTAEKTGPQKPVKDAAQKAAEKKHKSHDASL